MRNLVETLKNLGRSDSARQECRVTFAVPASLSHEAPPDFGRLHLSRRDAEQAFGVEYMNLCRKEARALSRCNIAVAKRIQLAETMLPILLPILQRHVETYSRDGGIPDDDRRQETLELTTEVLKLLIETYKIAFKQLYTGSAGLGTGVKPVELSAFRILELTKIQLRMMGLRYEVLSGAGWLVVNNVYFAMAAAGMTDTQIPLLEQVADLKEGPKTQSVRDMFLSVQMIAKFDILRWPTEWQEHFYAYCKSVNWLVETLEDKTADLPRNTAIAYCYDTRSARTWRALSDAELGPSTLLNWTKLQKKVTSDFLIFFNDHARGELSYFQKRLAQMSYNECLALVQLQFECVSAPVQQVAIDVGRGTACDMRLFIGFRSVYQLLHNIHGGKFGVGTRLADALAKRSAIFAEDNVATVESVWYLQYQDAELVRLKTQETKFTTGMKIGTMAAYGVGDDGIAKPQFGVIARFYRPSPNTVIVDVLKYGEYVEPVVVTTDLAAFEREDKKQGNLLGAIVVRDSSGEIKLLLPPLSTLRENTQLAMRRTKQPELLKLGKKQAVTKDFFLFRLASPPTPPAPPPVAPPAVNAIR